MANLENILTLNIKGTGCFDLKKQRNILSTAYAILCLNIDDYETLLTEVIHGKKKRNLN